MDIVKLKNVANALVSTRPKPGENIRKLSVI